MLRTPGVCEGRTTTGAEGCRECVGRSAGDENMDGGFCTAIIVLVDGEEGGGWVPERRRGARRRGEGSEDGQRGVERKGEVRICGVWASSTLFTRLHWDKL